MANKATSAGSPHWGADLRSSENFIIDFGHQPIQWNVDHNPQADDIVFDVMVDYGPDHIDGVFVSGVHNGDVTTQGAELSPNYYISNPQHTDMHSFRVRVTSAA